MATNIVYDKAVNLGLAVASGVESGDTLIWGGQPAVALTDRDSTSGRATLQFEGAIRVERTGDLAAVAARDSVYCDADDGDAGDLTLDDTDTFYGTCLYVETIGETEYAVIKIGGIPADVTS